MLGGMKFGYIHVRDIKPENASLESAVALTFPLSLKECCHFPSLNTEGENWTGSLQSVN